MVEATGLKVALLARAGEARDQLRRALADLGADLVIEADPNELATGALASVGTTTVLVSVEPAVEAALERLDDELLAPGLTVMFDEAETTSKLSGWDLNRWARHLAAKLLGRDVLPPGAEPEAHQEAAEHLVPGVPTTPAALASEARIADFAEEISASAAEVPSAYRPSDALPPADIAVDVGEEPPPLPAAWAAPPADEGDPQHLDLDLAALEQAMRLPPAAEPADLPLSDLSSTPVVATVIPTPVVSAPESLDFDIGSIDLRGLEMIDEPEAASPAPRPAASISLLSAKEISFDAVEFETESISLGESSSSEGGISLDVEEVTLTEAELAAFGEGAGLSFRAEPDVPAEADGGGLDLDPDLAKLAASFDENLEALSFESAPAGLDDVVELDRSAAATPSAAEPPPIPDFDFDDAPVTAAKPAAPALPDTGHLSLSAEDAEPVAAPAAPAKPAFDFGALSLELAPLDDAPASSPPPPAAAPAEVAASFDLGHLSLSALADEGSAAAPVGMVLVLSGIGGPDAVRQMVRALPAAFPLAVLLHQNLDGGRHDRFVEQLAKISRLPVALAEPTETPPAQSVRVLPEGLSTAGALSFPKEQGVAALIAAATTLDGAVVVLSGADEAAVEPLKQAMAAGTRVLVQDPASCFDGKAAAALHEAGASSVPASDLAARLDAFFSS